MKNSPLHNVDKRPTWGNGHVDIRPGIAERRIEYRDAIDSCVKPRDIRGYPWFNYTSGYFLIDSHLAKPGIPGLPLVNAIDSGFSLHPEITRAPWFSSWQNCLGVEPQFI